MTMNQMNRKLARAARDLDAIAAELHDRRFSYDWAQIEHAHALVGTVCHGFLDESTLASLDGLEDVVGRPEPGAAGQRH